MMSDMIHLARAFVRKYPASKKYKRPFTQTVVYLIVAGDVEGLTDEALHDCHVDDIDGTLVLTVRDREVQEHLLGWQAEDILREGMSGPLRNI